MTTETVDFSHVPLGVLLEKEKQLTSNEVAALFGVNSRIVNLWARAGKLPHIKTPGGHYRFKEALVREIWTRAQQNAALVKDPV